VNKMPSPCQSRWYWCSYAFAENFPGWAKPFLARDSIICRACYMLSPDRPSVCLLVCLSVTRVDQSKTV